MLLASKSWFHSQTTITSIVVISLYTLHILTLMARGVSSLHCQNRLFPLTSFLPAAKPSGLWIANVKLELLPAGEVETLVHLRAPPPPNLAGEVVTLVHY